MGGGAWGGGNDQRDLDSIAECYCRGCALAPTEFAAYGCGIRSLPPLILNGCGTSGGQLVPGFLVEAVQFGAIFTAPCNTRDQCHEAAGEAKARRETVLRDNEISCINTGSFCFVRDLHASCKRRRSQHIRRFFSGKRLQLGHAFRHSMQPEMRLVAGYGYPTMPKNVDLNSDIGVSK